MKRDNARIAVYVLGGAYLIYLAWELFLGLDTAGSEKPLMLIFSILFAVIGAVVVGAGLYSGWKYRQHRQQEAAESEKADGEAKQEDGGEKSELPSDKP